METCMFSIYKVYAVSTLARNLDISNDNNFQDLNASDVASLKRETKKISILVTQLQILYLDLSLTKEIGISTFAWLQITKYFVIVHIPHYVEYYFFYGGEGRYTNVIASCYGNNGLFEDIP